MFRYPLAVTGHRLVGVCVSGRKYVSTDCPGMRRKPAACFDGYRGAASLPSVCGLDGSRLYSRICDYTKLHQSAAQHIDFIINMVPTLGIEPRTY